MSSTHNRNIRMSYIDIFVSIIINRDFLTLRNLTCLQTYSDFVQPCVQDIKSGYVMIYTTTKTTTEKKM